MKRNNFFSIFSTKKHVLKTLLAPNVYESKKYKTMNYATSGCLRELLSGIGFRHTASSVSYSFCATAPKLHPSAWERCRYLFLSARSGSNASFLCRAQDNRQSHACLATSKPAVIKCESKEKALLMRWARIRTNELQSVKLNFWSSYFLKSSHALLKIVSSM